jgi:hypothetical protein
VWEKWEKVMKAYRGSRGIALLIVNLGTRWSLVVKLKPQPLYRRERTPVPFEEEAGWASAPVWTSGEEKLLLLLPRFKARTGQPVA